ncbi:transcriptional regulator PpsR [Yoonia sp.]|uniref:transcriptional regulator PpsR n=1 Tax=Yoonia sp. TaxID=2212373 RepID=UPI001A06A669|nr:transcriptional regulator PpsR [Yoonia sp.]MBE0412815.1 transcriptional regulator PpsR [Yoonia sp.]
MTSRGTKYWNSGAIPLIAPEILGDIISEVADLGIVISDAGIVLSVLANPAQDAFHKLDNWEGKDIRATLNVESVPKFENRLESFLAGKKDVRPVELNHSDESSRWEFPIRYSFHRIGPDGAILLLGSDLRPIAEMQQQLVKAQLALERDYEIQREYDTRFRVLMENIADPVMFVSTQSGEIIDANPAAFALTDCAREKLIGQQFTSIFDGRKRSDLVNTLTTQAISGQSEFTKTELRGKGQAVTIKPTLFRAAGERTLLCRIVTPDDGDAAADDLNRNMRDFYHNAPEAIVFASDNGDVLSANDAFMEMIDVAHDINLRGRSLADFMQRGSVDFKVMIDNANRAGRMRMYVTKIAGEYGSPRSVEISVTRLHAAGYAIFAFVMRDAGQAETVRTTVAPTSDDSMRSVAELVGSATLKEIVAETSDVVEKMCIETAIKLTMNNRVAAAEMLGLSRQSLYVKLRKFDLLSRDTDSDS